MSPWDILKSINSGHDLYCDLFVSRMEVGQILLPFVAAMGILVQAACGRYGL